MKKIKKLSLITLIAICSILSVYRINVAHDNEIAWDILGYYLYLPATFVHHDPMLHDITWIKKTIEERKLSGTMYMISENKEGKPVYFFLAGMALFYLPFFIIAGLIASVSGFATDGFSLPYQYSLVVGGIIYTIIGLIFLRKILRKFFSEKMSSLLMFIIVFGTNYVNHLTIDNLATVNIIFMLTTIIIWNTIKWHENYKGKHLAAIGICATLAALVKPSEAFVILIPILWNVTSLNSFGEKLKKLFAGKTALLITIVICFALVLPQMLYWHRMTGKFIYDSYKNPGIGLDLFSPHIMDVLFSYRKGWLLYTPVMIFSLMGFFILFKRNKSIFWACFIYFMVSFYIISSWTEWWYGAAFSTRPLIATYAVLAICLGYFIQYVNEKKPFIKLLFGFVVIFFVFLNQFQWWQYKNYILDPYRTTKDYYWATFLKTKVTDKDKELLMVFRDFSGNMNFTDEYRYQKSLLLLENFEDDTTKANQKENNNHFFRLDESQEFYPIIETPFNEITQLDHAWIKVSVDIRFPKAFEGSFPCIVNTMDRKGQAYGYYAPEIKPDSVPDQWKKVQAAYLTPEIRSVHDVYKCYLWKRSKTGFDIDNLKLEVYKRKQ